MGLTPVYFVPPRHEALYEADLGVLKSEFETLSKDCVGSIGRPQDFMAY
ncbi:MAG: hypothetical protein OJF47_002918 [Nitrospira sp.]|nr:MAG: hypothetical protein OJF47_002918 [Nitrospira sp.]